MNIFLVSTEGDRIKISDEWSLDSDLINQLIKEYSSQEDLVINTSFTSSELKDPLIIVDYLMCSDNLINQIGIRSLVEAHKNKVKLNDRQIRAVINHPILISLSAFLTSEPIIPTIPDDQRSELFLSVIGLRREEVENNLSRLWLIQYLIDITSFDDPKSSIDHAYNHEILIQISKALVNLIELGCPIRGLTFLFRESILKNIINKIKDEQLLFDIITYSVKYNRDLNGYYSSWLTTKLLDLIIEMVKNNSDYVDITIGDHLHNIIKSIKVHQINPDNRQVLMLLDSALRILPSSVKENPGARME